MMIKENNKIYSYLQSFMLTGVEKNEDFSVSKQDV